MEKKLWEVIANQCAPVLTDVKPSNLLILTNEEEDAFLQMEELPGISRLCLYEGEHKSTWLLCRRDRLESELVWPQTGEFLKQYGYRMVQESLDEKLLRLQYRFAEYKEGRQPFPHEMGVFLGYPLGDVIGFIKNAGQNCKCVGCWKVYCNECEAIKAFARFKKCTSVYVRLWNQGRSVRQLTVAA